LQTDRRGVVRVTRALTLGCVLAAVSWSRVTEAHGGNPRAYDIAFDPADPNDVFLKFDFWGAARTRDGGKTWQYACSELWGVRSTDTVTTSSLIAPGGRLLVAAKSHGLLVTDDFCGWQRVSALPGNVYDIRSGNSGLLAIAEVSRSDASVSTAQGGVFQSTDDGDHWQELGHDVPADFLGESVLQAASDSNRLYVGGRIINGPTNNIVVERSTDGGDTWSRTIVGVNGLDANTNWDARLRLVLPTNPDVVFLWLDGEEGQGTWFSDQIWYSQDGGTSFAPFFVGTGDLPGFALSPDGKTVALAGPGSPDPKRGGLIVPDGIQTASLDDALTRGQSAFQKVYDQQVWALDWTSSGLYAGNDDFTLEGVPPPFTFGVSHDAGHSFGRIMSICDVTFPSCAASSTMQVCVTPVDSQSPGQGGYENDVLKSDRCVHPPPSDAGMGSRSADASVSSRDTAEKSVGSGGGCSVSTSHRRGRGTDVAVLVLVALVPCRRRTHRLPRRTALKPHPEMPRRPSTPTPGAVDRRGSGRASFSEVS